MASDNGKSFLDKFAEVSAKVGNQVHLRSLRDAFATITPLYILAGIAVLINVAAKLFRPMHPARRLHFHKCF